MPGCLLGPGSETVAPVRAGAGPGPVLPSWTLHLSPCCSLWGRWRSVVPASRAGLGLLGVGARSWLRPQTCTHPSLSAVLPSSPGFQMSPCTQGGVWLSQLCLVRVPGLRALGTGVTRGHGCVGCGAAQKAQLGPEPQPQLQELCGRRGLCRALTGQLSVAAGSQALLRAASSHRVWVPPTLQPQSPVVLRP